MSSQRWVVLLNPIEKLSTKRWCAFASQVWYYSDWLSQFIWAIVLGSCLFWLVFEQTSHNGDHNCKFALQDILGPSLGQIHCRNGLAHVGRTPRLHQVCVYVFDSLVYMRGNFFWVFILFWGLWIHRPDVRSSPDIQHPCPCSGLLSYSRRKYMSFKLWPRLLLIWTKWIYLSRPWGFIGCINLQMCYRYKFVSCS